MKKEDKKNNENEIKEVQINIEEIEKKIKANNKMSPNEKQKLNRKIFLNFFISAIVMFVFIFILMGYSNIPNNSYIIDLKVFSIIAIVVTIIIFEIAYKKDSGNFTILGIESLIASFIILSLYYVLENNIYDYKKYLIMMVGIFMMYYLLKIIVIYIRDVHKYRKNANDIKKIIKKEEI